LLGKKSWNVYNADNIERVKRDEQAAAAREEAAEQRMQEVDAERRIQQLRGLDLPALTPDLGTEPDAFDSQSHHSRVEVKDNRKRQRSLENDLDAEKRYIRAIHTPTSTLSGTLKRSKHDHEPVIGSNRHTNLARISDKSCEQSSSARVEANSDKKHEANPEIFGMRFADAAGKHYSINQKPWYDPTSNPARVSVDAMSKNVWGREDPKRKDRDLARLTTQDPLSAIQKGVKTLRAVESERTRWKEERHQEFRDLAQHDSRTARKNRKDRVDNGRQAESHHRDSRKGSHPTRTHHHRRRGQDPDSENTDVVLDRPLRR
jgi:hypothetical protein